MAITGTTEDSKPRKSSVANGALADARNREPVERIGQSPIPPAGFARLRVFSCPGNRHRECFQKPEPRARSIFDQEARLFNGGWLAFEKRIKAGFIHKIAAKRHLRNRTGKLRRPCQA